jgi:phosphoribosylformylglycinamidine synthase
LGQPFTAIGAVNASSGTLEIIEQFTVSLDDLRGAHTGTLERHFAATAGTPKSSDSREAS